MIGFLFARQRSGTGALGSVLDRHPGLKYVGEVLHPDDQSNEANFFRYILQQSTRATGYIDPKRKAEVIEGYFEWLAAHYAPRLPIIDVKYRSLHNWNGAWQGLVEKPWIIAHILQKNYPLIHLKRDNFLETYVSGRLAEENGVWHAKSLDDVGVKATAVDIRQMSRFLADSAEEVRLIDSWCKAHRNIYVVDYAVAFDSNGNLEATAATKLQALFKLSSGFADLKPSFVKQSLRSVTSCITNLNLVERALRGTEFEWMTRE